PRSGPDGRSILVSPVLRGSAPPMSPLPPRSCSDSAHLLSCCDLDGRARDERSPVAEQEGRQLRDLGGPAEPPERNRSGQLGFGDAAVVELLLQHGVRISPGQIEFARTPWAPKSRARLRVSETTAAFELLYA